VATNRPIGTCKRTVMAPSGRRRHGALRRKGAMDSGFVQGQYSTHLPGSSSGRPKRVDTPGRGPGK
jgi:hypothetical protein